MLDSMSGVWCHERLKIREWRGEAVIEIQPKRDGWYLGLYQQPPETGNGLCAFGRKYEAHLELSHMLERQPWYRRIESVLPPLSSVVGEMWVMGEPASSVITHMKSGSRDLRFTPFAVPRWAGEDWAKRTVGDGIHRIREIGLEPMPTLPYMGESREELMTAARHWDAEGVVLKSHNFSGWHKVKEERTIDAVVTAIKPGRPDGKYIGECGSMHVSLLRNGKLEEVACISGMDDALRASVSSADVTRVCEVKYQYVAAGGRLRHPRFLRWRPDKPLEECTWDQLN